MSDDMKHTILANKNSKAVYLIIYTSQGSAATDLRGGGSFNSVFLRRSFLNLTVKKWKLVHVCRSYHKNKSGTYFWDTVYI